MAGLALADPQPAPARRAFVFVFVHRHRVRTNALEAQRDRSSPFDDARDVRRRAVPDRRVLQHL